VAVVTHFDVARASHPGTLKAAALNLNAE